MHVESGSGTKWSFLYKFAKSDIFQKKYAKQYKQVQLISCMRVKEMYFMTNNASYCSNTVICVIAMCVLPILLCCSVLCCIAGIH